jgi:hypothetical protein
MCTAVDVQWVKYLASVAPHTARLMWILHVPLHASTEAKLYRQSATISTFARLVRAFGIFKNSAEVVRFSGFWNSGTRSFLRGMKNSIEWL